MALFRTTENDSISKLGKASSKAVVEFEVIPNIHVTLLAVLVFKTACFYGKRQLSKHFLLSTNVIQLHSAVIYLTTVTQLNSYSIRHILGTMTGQ